MDALILFVICLSFLAVFGHRDIHIIEVKTAVRTYQAHMHPFSRALRFLRPTFVLPFTGAALAHYLGLIPAALILGAALALFFHSDLWLHYPVLTTVHNRISEYEPPFLSLRERLWHHRNWDKDVQWNGEKIKYES